MEMRDISENLVLSVAELDRRLKRAVEEVTGSEWVQGEVSSAKRAASGHVYFSLKDEREDAMIDCVLYRTQGLRYQTLLVDGAKVLLLGKATLWAPRGRLQFIVERVRPAGRGALLEALERLKAELAAEGLFAAERKRPLPIEPKVIGVVTSASGAAFWDIVAVASRRGSAHLVLSPAQVQGEGAAARIIAAIDLIEKYPGLSALIVGRGGGAGEDLMAFNDARLVRRLAQTKVPVISAVGHDIDVTFADLVADVRAATPSQAAELVVVDRAVLVQSLHRATASLHGLVERRLAEDRATLALLRSRLKDPRFVVFSRQQQLDERQQDLERAMRSKLRTLRPTLDHLCRRVVARHPKLVLERARGGLQLKRRMLLAGTPSRLKLLRAQLAQLQSRLSSLSPLAVLGRGYAIATRLDGRVILGPDDVGIGERFQLRLGRGSMSARAEKKGGDPGNSVDGGPVGIDHECEHSERDPP